MPMVHVEKQLASGNSETVTRGRDKDRGAWGAQRGACDLVLGVQQRLPRGSEELKEKSRTANIPDGKNSMCKDG